MIQSLKKFVSMAIQGTQVPMYTKHTVFLFFWIFKKKVNEKQNKAKLKTKTKKTKKKTC